VPPSRPNSRRPAFHHVSKVRGIVTGVLLPGLPVVLVVALSSSGLTAAVMPVSAVARKRLRVTPIAIVGALALIEAAH
jgi:hypothetical protein